MHVFRERPVHVMKCSCCVRTREPLQSFLCPCISQRIPRDTCVCVTVKVPEAVHGAIAWYSAPSTRQTICSFPFDSYFTNWLTDYFAFYLLRASLTDEDEAKNETYTNQSCRFVALDSGWAGRKRRKETEKFNYFMNFVQFNDSTFRRIEAKHNCFIITVFMSSVFPFTSPVSFSLIAFFTGTQFLTRHWLCVDSGRLWSMRLRTHTHRIVYEEIMISLHGTGHNTTREYAIHIIRLSSLVRCHGSDSYTSLSFNGIHDVLIWQFCVWLMAINCAKWWNNFKFRRLIAHSTMKTVYRRKRTGTNRARLCALTLGFQLNRIKRKLEKNACNFTPKIACKMHPSIK